MKIATCALLTMVVLMSNCWSGDVTVNGSAVETGAANRDYPCRMWRSSPWGDMCEVSMVTLIANPTVLSGFRLRVGGFARRLDDNWLLCLSETAARYNLGVDCIGFRISESELMGKLPVLNWHELQKEYGSGKKSPSSTFIVLVGIFREDFRPELGYFGRLESVQDCCWRE